MDAAGAALGAGVVVDGAGWIWLAGLVIAMIRLAVAHVRAALITSRARKLSVTETGVDMRETAAGSIPMTWGFLRPVVLIPADADRWTAAMRNTVIQHELMHVRRRDTWTQLLCELAAAVWWFHPLAWLGLRYASEAREQSCDDAVIQAGVCGTDYAGHLIDVARSLPRPALASAALSFGSQLEGRVRAAIDARTNRGILRRRMAAVVMVLSAILLGPLAGVNIWAEEVHKTGGDVLPPRLIQKVEPQYTEEARDAGIEGTVVLQFEVNREGDADRITVIESLDPGLDANAVAALRQWRFEPATKKGEPVRVGATVEINYRLE